jgi:hypothetical protein
VVFTGKEASAGSAIEKGIAVAPGNEDTFLMSAVLVLPLNGDAMGGVFAAEAGEARKADWSDLFETNEANAGDCRAVVKFRAEFGWELALDDFGRDAEVDEDAPANDALDAWEFHVVNAASQSFQTGS